MVGVLFGAARSIPAQALHSIRHLPSGKGKNIQPQFTKGREQGDLASGFMDFFLGLPPVLYFMVILVKFAKTNIYPKRYDATSII